MKSPDEATSYQRVGDEGSGKGTDGDGPVVLVRHALISLKVDDAAAEHFAAIGSLKEHKALGKSFSPEGQPQPGTAVGICRRAGGPPVVQSCFISRRQYPLQGSLNILPVGTGGGDGEFLFTGRKQNQQDNGEG